VQSPESSSSTGSGIEQPRLAHTFGRVAIATVASKIVGLARDIVLARAFGTGIVADAYYYATLFTGNFFVLFGGLNGPFDTCTVTTVIGKDAREQEAILWRILKVTFLFLLVITVAMYVVAPYTVSLISRFYSVRPSLALSETESRLLYAHELLTQSYIMLPMLVMTGVIGILYGAAHLKHRVTLSSVAPAIQSSIIILFVTIAHWRFLSEQGWPLALGTTIGAFFQLLAQVPGNFPRRHQSNDRAVESAVAEYKKMVSPALLSTSVGQLTAYVDSAFAISLGTGAWTALTYANRLIQLPLGVLVTAMIVPILPRFTRAVIADDTETLRKDFQRSVRFLWFATLPALAILAALAHPAVSLLFQGGAFTEQSVRLVTVALVFQLPSMVFYVARDLITRVFYAYRDTRTPFRIACFTLILKGLLDAVFVWWLRMEVAGISLATSAITAINFVVLALLISRQVNLGFKQIAGAVLRMCICSMLCWYATMASFSLMGQHVVPSKPGIVAELAIASGVGLFIYCLASWLLRIEEMNLVVDHLLKRNVPSTDDGDR
jgi:putative peptidoglycan lipid II flippase